MDKKEEQLIEQDAPLKNTDHAFVQVGKDGEPVIPQKHKNAKQEEDAAHTTPDKR